MDEDKEIEKIRKNLHRINDAMKKEFGNEPDSDIAFAMVLYAGISVETANPEAPTWLLTDMIDKIRRNVKEFREDVKDGKVPEGTDFTVTDDKPEVTDDML